MAHRNKVIRSINLPDGPLCVDIFQRPDGSFGFEEYRRDPEDGRGWFATSAFASQRFTTRQDATKAACAEVPWLQELLG